MSVKDLSNYETLRQKQKIANRYLKSAKERLGEEHKFYNSAVNRINMFQKKLGKTPSTRLTMAKLTEDMSEKYEVLLDSLIENTFLNPEKYEAHKERQLQFAIDEGWAKTREEAETVYKFANSEIVEELKDIGLGDIPSDLVEKYVKYTQEKLSENDFIEMSRIFLEEFEYGNIEKEQFYDFADAYSMYYKDYLKVQQIEFENGLEPIYGSEFVDLYNMNLLTPDSFISKAMSEYTSELQLGEDGMPMDFMDYLREYYL